MISLGLTLQVLEQAAAFEAEYVAKLEKLFIEATEISCTRTPPPLAASIGAKACATLFRP